MKKAELRIRIPDALKLALLKAAAKSVRSLNNEVMVRLQESLKK
jgi:hypothetical protein